MGRVSTSSPAGDEERRRAGGAVLDAVLDAVLERITYANEETGYTIARVATDRSGSDLVTVVGALLGVQPGRACAWWADGAPIRGTGGSSRSSRTPRCCRPRSRASNATSAQD
jgi:hypothetical protein